MRKTLVSKTIAPKPWTMPAWMEPYRKCFVNTGGNMVEELVNGNDDPAVNLPLSTLQACAKSQVAFLERLHEARALKGS